MICKYLLPLWNLPYTSDSHNPVSFRHHYLDVPHELTLNTFTMEILTPSSHLTEIYPSKCNPYDSCQQCYSLSQVKEKPVFRLMQSSSPFLFPLSATSTSKLALLILSHYLVESPLNLWSHPLKFIDHRAAKIIYLKCKSCQFMTLPNAYQPKYNGRLLSTVAVLFQRVCEFFPFLMTYL